MVSREFTGYVFFLSFLYALYPLTDAYISGVLLTLTMSNAKFVRLLTFPLVPWGLAPSIHGYHYVVP